MSAYGDKADIIETASDVRFSPRPEVALAMFPRCAQTSGSGRRDSIGAVVAARNYTLAHPSPSLERHSRVVALAMCPRTGRLFPAPAKRRCRLLW
jgi:hypothetical protein